MLAAIGAAGGLPVASAAEERTTIEIGITPTVGTLERGAEPIMLACESLERAITACVPREIELRIGPHGVGDPPEESLATAGSTLEWWRSNRPREYGDAELIVCSSAVDWDHGGMVPALGSEVGVTANGDWMYTERHRRVVLHEVGHCLGMRHSDGRSWARDGETVATPMAPVHPDRATLGYSPDAEATLRDYAGLE